MTTKGKERAAEPPIHEDDDDELSFFTFKPKKFVPRYSPPPAPPIATTNGHASDDGDSDNGTRKRKAKKKDKMEMADWTKRGASPRRKQGSTESSRARSSSSQADSIGTPDKGKGQADGKKRKVELTPPPEWGEEQVAQVNQLVDKYLNSTTRSNAAEEVVDDTDPYSSDRELDEVVNIRVRMKSDPAKKATGSENAIRQWEKLRTFKFPRRSPLSILVEDLARRLSKTPEDLVLIYNKQRIMSLRLTPHSFGITSDADMEGYEKHVWEALEKSRLAALEGDSTRYLDSTSIHPDVDDRPREPSPPPAAAPPNAIIVHIQCEWGEEKLGLQPTHTVKKLLRHYAKKHGKEAEVDRLTLMFDGEYFAPSKTMEEVGLESGDQVDLVVR